MAKQVGPLFFTGTIDGLIFYKLGDNYYIRSKGSYKSGRQMRKDPRYARTLQQADRFGEAVNLLKVLYYRHLPRSVRKHGLFGQLTGLVNCWLYAGKSTEEVRELLIAHLQQLAAGAATPPAPKQKAAKPTSAKQPTPITEHRTTNNDQHPIITEQPLISNGRLRIPKNVTLSQSQGTQQKIRLKNVEQHPMLL